VAVDFRAEKPTETPHAVIDVYHVVAKLELGNLLERQGHLAASGFVGAQVVLVIPFKQLMVGETGDFKVVVDKPFVQRFLDGSEGDGVTPVFKDTAKPVNLFGAVAEQVEGIAFVLPLLEGAAHQVEVASEHVLRGGVERQGCLFVAGWPSSVFHPTEGCRFPAQCFTAE